MDTSCAPPCFRHLPTPMLRCYYNIRAFCASEYRVGQGTTACNDGKPRPLRCPTTPIDVPTALTRRDYNACN